MPPDDRSPPYDADAIARQGRFVRALARGLVHDDEAAEELASRALSSALQQRPIDGPGLRAWFQRVVWRLFRRDQRDRIRRERRERLVAPHEATPSTLDLVAQIELQQQVARAFEALDEPSKSALFLRYFHDLTPTQIATQIDIPLGTVKSRLQRGLDQLREKLDAAHRGRRDEWLAALVPWVSIGGPTIVATKSKLLPITVAALLIAGTGVVVMETRSHDANESSASTTSLPAIVDLGAAAAPNEPENTPVPQPERAVVAVDAASLPFASGTVVDGAGAPIEGVAVVASRLGRARRPDESNGQLSFDYARLARDTLAKSDTSGHFTVASPGDDLVALWFVKERYGLGQWWELAAERSANQELRVVLERARPLRGTVRDSEGRPIPLAEVSVGVVFDMGQSLATRVARNLPDAPEYHAAPAIGPQRGKADANGRFDLACVPRGRCSAGASAEGYDYAALLDDELPDPWDVVLERSDLLIDVVDADTQEPICDASAVVVDRATDRVLQAACSSWAGEGETARRTGHRLNVPVGFGHAAMNTRGLLGNQRPLWLTQAHDETLEVVIRVLAAGYRGEFIDTTLSTKREPPHLRFELVPDDGDPGEASIAGRVAGASGAELRLYLFSQGFDAATLQMGPPLLTTRSGDDGAFAFHELPKGHYLLAARARGCAAVTREVDSPCGGLLLELHAAALLEVVVTDHAGHPVKGAVVFAQDEFGKEAHLRATGADGLARFQPMPEGRLRALAFVVENADDYASFDRTSPIDLGCFALGDVVEARAGETARLELALLERRRVRLHFQHDDGTPVKRVALQWKGTDGANPIAAIGTEFERLRALKIELDSRGDGEVDLYPGRYFFQASETRVQRRVVIDVPREGDANMTVALPDLGPTGTVRGRIVALGSGSPVLARDVTAVSKPRSGAAAMLGTQTTDFEGRFEFAGVPAGDVELWIHADCFGGRDGALIDDPESPYGRATWRAKVEADGTTALEIELPPIKSKLANVPKLPLDALVTDAATGSPLAGATIDVHALRGDGVVFAGSARTGSDGRARAEVFAAEKYLVSVNTPWGVGIGPPTPPKYRSKDVELAPKEGVLTVEVELKKRE